MEVRKIINNTAKLKNNKAQAVDKLLTCGGSELMEIIQNIIIWIWNDKVIPESWTR